MCSADAAFVAPGPRVTKQTPGRPLELALRLGHEGCAALLAAADEADALAVLVEAVEHGQEALAGNAEQVSTPWATSASTSAWPAGREEVGIAHGLQVRCCGP